MSRNAGSALLVCAIAAVSVLAASRGGAADVVRNPGVGQAAPSPTEVSLLQTRVAALEKKLDELQREHAALQRQYAVHTHKHSRTASDCTSTNLFALKKRLDSNSGPGMDDRVCLLHPGSGAIEVTTTGPSD